MGKHIHRLSEKDFDNLTAVCANCGPVKLAVYGNSYRCYVAYREHQNVMKKDRKGTFKDLKTDTCYRCGFKGDLVQMDLDHKDGDRTNHAEENMGTLCANCHRLKSFRPHLFALPPA